MLTDNFYFALKKVLPMSSKICSLKESNPSYHSPFYVRRSFCVVLSYKMYKYFSGCGSSYLHGLLVNYRMTYKNRVTQPFVLKLKISFFFCQRWAFKWTQRVIRDIFYFVPSKSHCRYTTPTAKFVLVIATRTSYI